MIQWFSLRLLQTLTLLTSRRHSSIPALFRPDHYFCISSHQHAPSGKQLHPRHFAESIRRGPVTHSAVTKLICIDNGWIMRLSDFFFCHQLPASSEQLLMLRQVDWRRENVSAAIVQNDNVFWHQVSKGNENWSRSWICRGVVYSTKSSYTSQKNSKNPRKIKTFQGFFQGFKIHLIWEWTTPWFQCLNPFLFIKSSYTQRIRKKIRKNPKKSEKSKKKFKKSEKI